MCRDAALSTFPAPWTIVVTNTAVINCNLEPFGLMNDFCRAKPANVPPSALARRESHCRRSLSLKLWRKTSDFCLVLQCERCFIWISGILDKWDFTLDVECKENMILHVADFVFYELSWKCIHHLSHSLFIASIKSIWYVLQTIVCYSVVLSCFPVQISQHSYIKIYWRRKMA